MLRGDPQPDARITERLPADPRYQSSDDLCRDYKDGDQQAHALWNLYALSKYAAAKKGPRQPGRRPEDLRKATETLREALEQCWRAGFKSEDLAKDFIRMMKQPSPEAHV